MLHLISTVGALLQCAWYLLIDRLEIYQSVGDVFWVSDVVFGDLLVTASALQNTVDKIGQSCGLIITVLLQPICDDIVGAGPGTK